MCIGGGEMLYVVKRDGRKVEFNTDKIRNAIKKASNEVGESLKESEVLICIQRVIKYIEESQKEKVSVEEVQILKKLILHIEEKELGLEI